MAGNDANPENGAFAKFIAVKGDLQMHIPPGVSFEAAATVGVGIPTTCYALYQELGLPLPGAAPVGEKKDVFIYGGSTATGTIAIQFARLYASMAFPYAHSLLIHDFPAPTYGSSRLAHQNTLR